MEDELKILSAGAVKPGLSKVIDAFRRESDFAVRVSFATAPAILKKIGGGESVDFVVAPPKVLDALANTGKFPAADRIMVGRIGGSENPWLDGYVGFTLVDPTVKHCHELGDDGCEKPWDFC